MVHLADPDSMRKTISLGENEEFVSFVEKYPSTSNVSISFLLRIDGSINLQTYEYSKPYEKKQFDDDIYWSKKN